MVRKSERDTADLQAIADIPILIAELKRCYSLIDDLQDESILMLALEEVADTCLTCDKEFDLKIGGVRVWKDTGIYDVREEPFEYCSPECQASE
jgi:hypothetical protein